MTTSGSTGAAGTPARADWNTVGQSRPEAVVTLARRLYAQATLGKRPRPAPWHRLTDERKVPWILRADQQLAD